MYILDTSAIRGISGKKLAQIVQNHKVGISTMTFLELFSHLENPEDIDKPDNFKKTRGNVLKCKLVTIMHDPYAVMAIGADLRDDLNQSRLEDAPMFTSLIDLLEKSTSLEEFNSQKLVSEEHGELTVGGSSLRAHMTLVENEEKYVAKIVHYAREIARLYPNSIKNGLSDEQYGRLVFSEVKGKVEKHRGMNTSLQEKDFILAIGKSYYFKVGYELHRASEYLRKSEAIKDGINPDDIDADKLNIDCNDYEDSFIVFSLNIDTANVLVVDDKGTQQAMWRAKEILMKSLEMNRAPFDIITRAEFENLYNEQEEHGGELKNIKHNMEKDIDPKELARKIELDQRLASLKDQQARISALLALEQPFAAQFNDANERATSYQNLLNGILAEISRLNG